MSWTQLGPVEKRGYKKYFLCRCVCGVERFVRSDILNKPGHSTNCGCLQREQARKQMTRHGMDRTPLYRRWESMKQRCNPLSAPALSMKRYVNRGITVCEEWQTFEPFRDWALANGFDPCLQLDRIDNSLGYSPGNCRWVDARTNQRNRDCTVILTAYGESKPMQEWLEDPRCVTCENTIYGRLRRGWSHEEAISAPANGAKPANP